MLFYLIPLLFIDTFLLFAAFRGFIMSSLEGSEFYRLLGMLSIGLYAFLSCEVLLDVLEFYFPIQMFESLSISPLYAMIVSLLTMIFAYRNGTKWVAGYLVKLEEQE